MVVVYYHTLREDGCLLQTTTASTVCISQSNFGICDKMSNERTFRSQYSMESIRHRIQEEEFRRHFIPRIEIFRFNVDRQHVCNMLTIFLNPIL